MRLIFKNEFPTKKETTSRLTEKKKIVSLIKKLHPYRFENGLIRIGPNKDGGYLLPNDLNNIQACFSPGVGGISEFELWCYNNGMKIYLADKSVDHVNLSIPTSQYSFIKKYVGCTNNEDFITLDEWVNSNITNEKADLLLQMDIEGGEYNALINTSDSLMKRFRILVIEFHFLEQCWVEFFFDFVEKAFNKILQTHVCVHIHPNNYKEICSKHGVEIPKVAEFTFLRKDRISSSNYENKFPHELDYDNDDVSSQHIVLPKNWYKRS